MTVPVIPRIMKIGIGWILTRQNCIINRLINGMNQLMNGMNRWHWLIHGMGRLMNGIRLLINYIFSEF